MGELGDITGFLEDGPGTGPVDLDWLDVDEKEYQALDTLPKQNLDVVPDLKALWRHQDEPSTNFVPNTGAPRTMADITDAGPIRGVPEDILRTARLAVMQSPNDPHRIAHALSSRYDATVLASAKTALTGVLAERGLLGGYYIDAADFPACAKGAKKASDFVRRFAPDARFIKAKAACKDCVHRTAYASGMGTCAVFHKEIQLEVPYTDELADAVEQSQQAKGKAASKMAAAPRGKAQKAIMEYLGAHGGKAQLTDMSKDPSFRGVHFAQIMKAAEALKKGGLISFDGKSLSKKAAARERIQAALLAPKASDRQAFTGRPQKPQPRIKRASADTTKQALVEVGNLTKQKNEAARQKLAAIKARPMIAMLRREMLKGRSYGELGTALKLAFDVRDLQETRPEWEPIFREAGLYGAVYATQDSFDDCRVGADFLSKHGSKTKAIVAGDKCGSCIFSKVGRCMMYGKKLVKKADEILTPEVVAQVIDEHKLVGTLPYTAHRVSWGDTPAEALKEIYRVASGHNPTAPSTSLRGVIERGFYGHSRSKTTGELTRRAIVKKASQLLNEGLYGNDLKVALMSCFEVRDLVGAAEELRPVFAEQGLQGIKFIDPTVYDDYGHGCKMAASKHRSRAGVQYLKAGDKCGSCVFQTRPGTCSVINKQLVSEVPYIDRAAEQKAMLASGPSTEVGFASLMNNGLTMMQEYELQHRDPAVDINAATEDPVVTIEFGAQEVKL